MIQQTNPGGSFTLPNTLITLSRLGYGAVQLAGQNAWGLPRDVNTAVAVLREELELGIRQGDGWQFNYRGAVHGIPSNTLTLTQLGYAHHATVQAIETARFEKG